MNKVYLAGGCFWCIQDYISSFPGIKKVVSGYSGGKEKAVTYKEVKEQKTGHRETIEVNYNEEEVSLNEIIDIYLSYVDPLDKEGHTKMIGRFNYFLVYNDDNFRFSKLTNVKSTIRVIDTIKPTIKVPNK